MIKSFKDLRELSPDYRIMLLMLLLMKAGQFMVLPFLAIFLATQSGFSASAIGFIVGSGPFVYAFAGLFAGVFSDRFSPKTTMIAAQVAGGISIFFFFSFNSFAWYLFANVMTGLSRAFFDIGSKAYKVFGLSLHERRLRFSLRYMIINTAAAIGPAAGAYFAAIHSYVSFKIIGVLYVLLALLAAFVLCKPDHELLKKHGAVEAHLFDSLSLLLRNRKLQMLSLIGFIFWMAYTQIDSTIPLHLHATLTNGVRVYSLMLIVNAAGCALVPLFLVQMMKNMAMQRQGMIGMFLFASSYFIMSFVSKDYAFLLAMIILVFAESIIMPLNDLILSSLAPSHQVGMYYGAMSFASLGMGLGPMLGGFLYQHFGLRLVLCGCATFCLLAMLIYKQFSVELT